MLNSANTQRFLRPEGAVAATPVLRPTGHVPPQVCFPALRHTHGLKNSHVCNAQLFGRGQPPKQPQPMSLARRPLNDYMEPTQPSFIKLSDIMDKEVISSTTGRKLGKLGEAWVDPSRLEVTCFDLENNGAVGVVPLLTIKQAGDVVLVQEDGVLRQPLDSRFGFTKLLGWEVRTPSNRALGKIRDLTFSRETGTISKIEFDDFGVRFLRADFFDRFAVPADAVRQCAYGIVSLVAENVQYQEKQGLLSSLLRRVGGAQQLAGLLADGSPGSEAAASLLPQGYSYEQWQNDVRMWEAQTGVSYEDYMMQTGQQQPLGARRNALPPGRPQALLPEPGSSSVGNVVRQPGAPSYALPPAGSSAIPQAQPRPGMPNGIQQPQQQMYGAPGQQVASGYGSGYGVGADPRFRGSAAQPPPRGASAPSRYPPVTGPGQQQTPQQQPLQPQWTQPGMQPPTVQPQQQPPQQQWSQKQWNQQQQQSMQQAPLQQQQPQQLQQTGQRSTSGAPGRPQVGLPVGGQGGAAAGGGPGMQTGQSAPQYGWPGSSQGGQGGGPAGAGPNGFVGGATPPGGQNGTMPAAAGGHLGGAAVGGSSSGGIQMEEWMARGPQGQPVPEGVPGRPSVQTGAAAQPAQLPASPDLPGWDVGPRPPY